MDKPRGVDQQSTSKNRYLLTNSPLIMTLKQHGLQ